MSKAPSFFPLSLAHAVKRLPATDHIKVIRMQNGKTIEQVHSRKLVVSLIQRFGAGEAGERAKAEGFGLVVREPGSSYVFVESKPGFEAKLFDRAEIKVSEIVRAGDVILFRFKCQVCGDWQMSGENHHRCTACGTRFLEVVFDLSSVNKRVLAPSFRKVKQGLTKRKVQQLWDMQAGYCAYCDTDLRTASYHIDHILPFAAGGSNDFTNLCLACPPCNLAAGSFVLKDFLAKREFVRAKRGMK